MTELIVDRLTASATADDAPRVRRLMSAMVDSRLDEALSTAALPPGDWCVRRVDLTMSLGPERTDAAVAGEWAQALVSALVRRMSKRDPEVVHYRRPFDGLADLLAGAAVGRVEREWAWRRIGLLGPGDPSATGSPRAAAMAAARRRPELAMAGLLGAVAQVGVAALHRMLAADGWTELGGIVLAIRGESAASPHGQPLDVDPDLVDGIRARSRLAADFRRARARLRVDAVTARAWAALVIAEAEPALAGRRNVAAILAVLAVEFESTPGRRARAPQVSRGAEATIDDGARRGPRDTAVANAAGLPSDKPCPEPPPVRAGAEQLLGSAGVDPAATRATDANGRSDASRDDGRGDDVGWDDTARYDTGRETAEWHDADREGSGVDSAGEGHAGRLPTAWAGLLFLLSAAARAGVPDDLLAHDALAGHPLSWALYHVGRLLVPAEPDDPALFALAGVAPQPVSLSPEPATVPGASEALARQAARWAAATVERLGAEGDPMAVVGRIAARDGAISVWPGWVEVHLPLDGVDVDVRRAGLDVDPGWVPWLGTVVVFRYA